MPDGALAVLEKKAFNRYKVKTIWDEAPYVVHSETGVDDKNGTRIFEGDICATSKVKDGIVAYSQQIGAYCIFDYNNDVYYILTDEHGEDVEVVGNVFDGVVVDISESEDGNEAS
jgi:hypothetical protein